MASYGDRIRTIDQANRGINRSRNPAIALAGGEYIAFLDADDIWLPRRLALSCSALERNTGAVLTFTNVIPMDERGELGPPWIVSRAPTLSDLMTRVWGIYPSAVTMRRSTLVACGGFDEELTNLSDAYLWMQARELGSFEYLPEPLTIYRTMNFSHIGDKYRGGLRRFARGVRRRYGRAGRPVTREMQRIFASSLVAKALDQIDHGATLPACWSLARAMRISPSFFLGTGVARRMLRPRNFRRNDPDQLFGGPAGLSGQMSASDRAIDGAAVHSVTGADAIEAGVSILLCTRNGASRLPAALAHLRRQRDVERIKWEIVLVDNASTDGTAQRARECWRGNESVPLRIISEPQPGLSLARRTGFDAARYAYTSVVDDDNLVCERWVARVVEVMDAHPEVGRVAAIAKPSLKGRYRRGSIAISSFTRSVPYAHREEL